MCSYPSYSCSLWSCLRSSYALFICCLNLGHQVMISFLLSCSSFESSIYWFLQTLYVKNFQFFPEASEVKFARQSAFGGTSFKLDYLTKPSFFEDFGFFEKVKMADRVKLEDELFLVAYPYFNVNGSFKYPFFLYLTRKKINVWYCLAFQKCLW